ELPVGKEDRTRARRDRPGHGGGEGLGGLGPVGRHRAETEKREPGARHKFAAFVGVEQGAEAQLEVAARARGHDVLDPVEEIRAHRRPPGVLQPALTHPAELAAVAPAREEG
ncbi:MAG: hypothetical protein ACK56I_04325, partial [bacterium]